MASSNTLPRVLAGYRRLFRARKKLFHGDNRALIESRIAIRAQFKANRNAVGAAQMEGLLTMVDEAEDMLLTGIVQGQLNEETGNYQVKVKPEHTESIAGESNTTGNKLEPITAETVSSLQDNSELKVEVTKSSGADCKMK